MRSKTLQTRDQIGVFQVIFWIWFIRYHVGYMMIQLMAGILQQLRHVKSCKSLDSCLFKFWGWSSTLFRRGWYTHSKDSALNLEWPSPIKCCKIYPPWKPTCHSKVTMFDRRYIDSFMVVVPLSCKFSGVYSINSMIWHWHRWHRCFQRSGVLASMMMQASCFTWVRTAPLTSSSLS